MTAFETLKLKLIKYIVQLLPRLQRNCMIDTYVLNKQIGCVQLLKQKNKTNRTIGYWSCSSNHDEKAYDMTAQECLAVVRSALLLRLYREGCWCTICADHDGLKRILNVPESTRKVVRCGIGFPKFKFGVIQCEGIKDQAPDALSNPRTVGADETPIEDNMPRPGITSSTTLQRLEEVNISARR